MVKIKWDNAKYSLSLTRKTDILCFTFLTSARPISHFFNQKLFICIHLSFFMHIIQNDTILPSSNITYWKSGIFMWMERQTTKAKRILFVSLFVSRDSIYLILKEFHICDLITFTRGVLRTQSNIYNVFCKNAPS